MVRLTADLIWKSPHFFNAIKERELDLRGLLLILFLFQNPNPNIQLHELHAHILSLSIFSILPSLFNAKPIFGLQVTRFL